MIINHIKKSIKSSFHRIKKETVNKSTTNSSQIKQILNYLCENKEPFKKYDFLILLTDENLNKNKSLQKISLPGKLVIEKYSEMKYNTTKYSFENNPIPNQLYIKLQKEQIYVLYSNYQYKLLESQFNEFYEILYLIGVKYINTSKIIKNLDFNNFFMDLGLNVINKNIEILNKIYMKNEKDTSLLITQDMNFLSNKNTNFNKIINKIIENNYYYLPYQIELQNLIVRRIENNELNEKYTYYYNSNIILNNKILKKLNKLKILNPLDNLYNQIPIFEIEYNIEFYNNNKNHYNKIYNNQKDEESWLMKIIERLVNQYFSI
jgi:hypothetical protein